MAVAGHVRSLNPSYYKCLISAGLPLWTGDYITNFLCTTVIFCCGFFFAIFHFVQWTEVNCWFFLLDSCTCLLIYKVECLYVSERVREFVCLLPINSPPLKTLSDNFDACWICSFLTFDRYHRWHRSALGSVVFCRKRLSMSVDRGQMKMARKVAALVGPARRVLYPVTASPELNAYALQLQCICT